MKLHSILYEKESVIEGTNCGNCQFVGKAESVEVKELNKQGGVDTTDNTELKLAEAADLLTLPGSKLVKEKHHCDHPKVNQYVTQRMCCAYWSNTGAYRSYGKQEIGK